MTSDTPLSLLAVAMRHYVLEDGPKPAVTRNNFDVMQPAYAKLTEHFNKTHTYLLEGPIAPERIGEWLRYQALGQSIDNAYADPARDEIYALLREDTTMSNRRRA